MTSLPTGTVTFLFTDIEGSTKLARAHPETWESLRERHDSILRSAIESNNGFVFQVIGDSFCSAFHKPGDAVHAALKAQRDLQRETWGQAVVRVRMGVHTGEAEPDGTDYRGYVTLSLVQRLMSAGHGGQILLSNATKNVLGGELSNNIIMRDLGEHTLKDLPQPMRIFQVLGSDLQSDFPVLRALDAFPNNLPRQLTTFIGRDKEIAEITEAIGEHRLVTLTGRGGSGKTRLALQVAGGLRDLFQDGVWLVELAPLETVEVIVPTIAAALGFSFYEGGDPRQQLLNYLREKSMLLILDNFEHLLSGVDLVIDILTTAAQTKILSTSRSRLNVRGEKLFHLGGMDVPALEAQGDIREYSAIKLFLQGARLIRPDLELVPESLKYVVRICHLVEGMPLGILLAVAWGDMLAPQEIAEEIEKSLDFLAAEERDVPDRQRSLRAVFDYTWRLLATGEQEAFKGLSAFRGGFTREAAEQVTGASLQQLKGLIDKSLLYRDLSGRYGMHELLRQYAVERLEGSNGANELHQRHARYFLQLAERAEPELAGPMQATWSVLLRTDYDNLRAALAWSLKNEDASIVLRLVGALAYFWFYSGPVSEGEEWFSQALGRAEGAPLPVRAKALVGGGLLAFARGYAERAEQWIRTALAIGRKLQDKSILASSLELLSMCATNDPQEYEEGIKSAEEALSLCRELDDKQGLAQVENSLGELMRLMKEYERARIHYEQSLDVSRQIGNQTREAVALGNLGYCAQHRGNFQQAEKYALDALTLFDHLGLKHQSAWAVSLLAGPTVVRGNAIKAATLLGASEAIFAILSSAQQPADTDEIGAFVTMTQQQLTKHDFEAAWAEGRRMTYEQAIALALGRMGATAQ